MRLSAAICTANVAGAKDGDWVPVSPYGDHMSPCGSYVQKFGREQAEKVVATWNSITGIAARAFKNLWHGLGGKTSCPVWDGHPETDKRRWPKAKLLAEITDLRAGDGGLEGRLRWTGNARPAGPLYPSPLWWHWPPAGDPPAVYPELLESVGLVPAPNIAAAPAWTQNARLAENEIPPTPQPTQTENTMDRKIIIQMLGLAEDASDEQIQSALQGAGATANSLQTANAAKADLETKLATASASLAKAEGSLAAMAAERDGLQTANAALVSANETLVSGALDLAEKRGAITPAEREGWRARIATANTSAAALQELQTRKAMNTQSVEINGNRVDLSTANARQSALETAISQRMRDENLDRAQAFAKCQADPNLRELFASMQDPTRKS